MNRRNHVSRFDGIPKTKLQGSEASHPKSLQSQMPPRPENRLLLNSLRGYSRPTNAPANHVDLVNAARGLAKAPIGGQRLIKQLQEQGTVHTAVTNQNDDILDVPL